MVYTSEHPIFYVTVDIVVLTIRDDRLCALVVERGGEPFKGRWALPGGFVEPDEGLYDAARPESAREACERLLADPAGSIAMAARGRAWVGERCLWRHRAVRRRSRPW